VIVASTKTSRPFKTIQEVIAFAKANPNQISMAKSGLLKEAK
jgi:tripartite-type tricarboxylate transporter receptor subunit TctC